MITQRMYNKLERTAGLLRQRVDKLTEENTTLKRENEALLERVELANKLIEEYDTNMKEVKKIRQEYNDAYQELLEVKDKYSKEFKQQLKRITKQK